MADPAGSVLARGFLHLVVSQISTRLITFFLNLLTARLLTIDAYGLASVQFHLINTLILFLSREGFRRGCLRAQQSSASPDLVTSNVLAIAALCIPLGALTTLCTCGVALRGNASWTDAYAHAIYLQGLAAMLELLSEPLYILAQLRLRLQLRVFAEASATLARGVATLALLKASSFDVGISLSMAQCIYAAVTLVVYIGGMAREWPHIFRQQGLSQSAASTSRKQATAAVRVQQPERSEAQQVSSPHEQHALKPSAKATPIAGTAQQPQMDEDEGWQLLDASGSPESTTQSASPQPSHPHQQGAVGDARQHSEQGHGTQLSPSSGGSRSLDCYNAGHVMPSHVGQKSGDGGTQSASRGTAEQSSKAQCDQDMDLHAETQGKSLLYPWSASAAAQLTDGLEARAPETCERDELKPLHQQPQNVQQSDSDGMEAEQKKRAASDAEPAEAFDCKEVLWRCTIFTIQAITKLALAEGSKVVMVASQSSYSQGIYGLVSNLGSLVVRTIFQPFEEAAFLAFSQREAGVSKEATRRTQAKELSLAVRCVSLVGLLAVAFGPAYTYMLLRVVYGQRWSETEAPRALAVYCLYILLLAVNGILEAFVHAVADSRDIAIGNGWLVACSAVHMGLACILVKSHGAVGLIGADAVNMALRIGFCLVFVARQFRGVRGFQLRALFPSKAALSALAAASMVCLAADSVLFKGTALPKTLQEEAVKVLQTMHTSLEGVGFMPRAAVHAGIGASTLAVLLLALYRSEGSLVAGIRALQKSAVSQ